MKVTVNPMLKQASRGLVLGCCGLAVGGLVMAVEPPPAPGQPGAASAKALEIGRQEGNALLLNPQALAESLPRLRYDADRNNSAAQFQMGLIYAYGIGVYKDIKEAVRWYEKAAAGGRSWAQVNLGTLYANGYTTETGEKVPSRRRDAFLLFTAANAAGNSEGTVNLGLLYQSGIPEVKIAPDPKRALHLFNVAASRGSAAGAVMLTLESIRPLVDQFLSLNEGGVPTRGGKSEPAWKLPAMSAAQKKQLGFAWATALGFRQTPGAGADRILGSLPIQVLAHAAGIDTPAVQEQLSAAGTQIVAAFRTDPSTLNSALGIPLPEKAAL